jgi:insecticidal toxin complex protein TccC
MHWHTPTLSANDGRGLPVRQVAYLRSTGEVTSLVNRQQHDAAGHLVAQFDPRLSIPSLTTIYRLDGEALKTDSVDAGWRLHLPGLAGEPLQRWDARNNHWRTTFDDQLRVVAVEENGEAGVDLFTYADASADAGHNQRGQLLEQSDRAGTLRTDSFALTGEPLRETRTFLDSQAFTSRRLFSPLGAVLEQTDGGGHRQQSRYGLAGQLRHMQLLINGDTDWRTVLRDAHYNATDQIIEQQAGNGVRSQWSYDPADGRLHTQSSRKDNGEVLQDFEYVYDRVGNITRIEDHAFEPIWFANQRVDGHRDFSYDSLYRLISATGYDDGPLSDIPGLPKPTDPNNRLNYTQTYTYDCGGNLKKLVHARADADHTVQMCIDSVSNRGVRCKPGDPDPDFDTLFDRHGNLLAVQAGQPLRWNVRDELQDVTLVARDDGRNDAEYYAYSQGERVFKRHEWHGENIRHFHQVRYLPGLEIRSKDNGEELHVIQLGNARCLHWVSPPPAAVENNQLRYSLDDHLGSCTLELDQNARMISHEGYYPFGATAWMVEKPETGISYKFIRYSGKEMDVSGLYYYGARYYAPWLQRWVSPDPAGTVDGLNLYVMLKNSPMTNVDNDGQAAFGINQINSIANSAANTASDVHSALSQFDGADETDINQDTRDRTTFFGFLFSKRGWTAFGVGVSLGASVGGAIGTVVPGIGNAIGGLVGGLLGGLAGVIARYHFFKRDIRLSQVLQTEKIKDAAQTLAGATNDVANGKIPQVIQEQLFQMSDADDAEILNEVKESNLTVRSMFRELLDQGKSMTGAYLAVKDLMDKAKEVVNDPTTALNNTANALSEESAGTGPSQQAARPVAAPRARPKPVAAPRKIRIGSTRSSRTSSRAVMHEESTA